MSQSQAPRSRGPVGAGPQLRAYLLLGCVPRRRDTALGNAGRRSHAGAAQRSAEALSELRGAAHGPLPGPVSSAGDARPARLNPHSRLRRRRCGEASPPGRRASGRTTSSCWSAMRPMSRSPTPISRRSTADARATKAESRRLGHSWRRERLRCRRRSCSTWANGCWCWAPFASPATGSNRARARGGTAADAARRAGGARAVLLRLGQGAASRRARPDAIASP